MNMMMILLTILLLPVGEQVETVDERVAVDMVLHIQFTNADGYAVVDTPVTYRPDDEYGTFTFGCVTDGNGECDIPVQFETSITHPSVFGSVYVHDVHVQSAIFRRLERELTIPIQSGANRLNPHETIHDHAVQIVPVSQETVAVMLSRPPQVEDEVVMRPEPSEVTSDVPSETVDEPLIPTIVERDDVEEEMDARSSPVWWWVALVVLAVGIRIAFIRNSTLWKGWRS